MTMLKPSDCVEAQSSQVTCPRLKENAGMELKLNDFRLEVSFNVVALIWIIRIHSYCLQMRGHAPQGDRHLKRRLVVSWWIFPISTDK